MNKQTFTALYFLLLFATMHSGCMKKEIAPIPAAQTPYECSGTSYFQNLYGELTSAFIFPTADGRLLLYDQSSKFAKADTSGKVLWTKKIGSYGDGNVFRRRGYNQFYSQTKTSASFTLSIYDGDLNLLHSADFPVFSNYNIFPAKDSSTVVAINAIASKSNERKLQVSWLDSDLHIRWTYREKDGYNFMLDIDEDEQYIYLGGSQYNFNESTGIINGSKAYAVKLDKADGHAIWAKTFTAQDAAFSNIDSVVALPNGHLRIAGTALRSTTDERIYMVLETDANGSVLSSNTVAAPSSPYVERPIEAFANDRHLIIQNQSSSIDEGEIQVTMYNTVGTMLWHRQFGGEGLQSATSAMILPSGNVLIAGATYYHDGTSMGYVSKMLLIKCDAAGNTCY